MSVLDNFQDWKEFLGERVNQARASGMEQNTIENAAYELGSYLAEKVDPRNDQERLLKQLWEAGDEDEKRALAALMVKLVDRK